ncbi:MAG TPA: phosphotransferase [Acidimicrobiales bacterium]
MAESAATRTEPARIPRDWEVSPAWITHLVNRDHPGAVVTEVSRVGGSEGTSSRAVLRLTYGSGSGPATLFAKTKGDPLRRLFQWMTDNAFIEGRLALSGAPLPIEHPRFYGGVVERRRLDDMVVMADMSAQGAVLNDATTPLSVEEVASGLRGLARLHSRYWGMRDAAEVGLDWVRPCAAPPTFRFLVRLGCTRGLPRLRDHLPSEVAALGASGMIHHWRRQVRAVRQGPQTLLHGDAHVGNTYTLPNGDLGFYDWGVVRSGHWSFDVGYFVISALDVEDRRRHAAELVEEYRSALEVPEPDRPSRQEAWLRFRTATPYGLAIWVTTGAEDGYQAPAICQNLTARFGQAFLDLDTPAALSELGV